MDSEIGKKIEKELGKSVAKDVQKDFDKQVKEEVDKKVESVTKDIKKQVEKNLKFKLYEGAKKSALDFKEEFKKQTVIAISAALGFLVALSWRTPIQGLVDQLNANLGLTSKVFYVEFGSALVITLLAVLVLMSISKWNVNK